MFLQSYIETTHIDLRIFDPSVQVKISAQFFRSQECRWEDPFSSEEQMAPGASGQGETKLRIKFWSLSEIVPR